MTAIETWRADDGAQLKERLEQRGIAGDPDENNRGALPGVVPKSWLGNAPTVPVHHDHPCEPACVVAGRRRLRTALCDR